MIREQWAKLTPSQQLIKIAELCGWKSVRHEHHSYADFGLRGIDPKDSFTYGDMACIPDFLNDLNAMHEAEKLLSPVNRCVYFRNLDWVVMQDDGTRSDGIEAAMLSIGATAAQRAEAFVLTMEE